MSFRVLLVADVHCGKYQYNSFERTQDFAAVLPQVVQIAKDEEVDLVIVAGDLIDAYHIGSFSTKAVRLFCDEMSDADIGMLITAGNHEVAKMGQEGRAVSRIDSLTDRIIRPRYYGLDGTLNDPRMQDLRIVAADWMPATKIQEFLDGLPPNLDVLVMHQSVEGFIPKVSCEMKKEQLLGKARIVLVGDLHITATQTLSDGTIILSPGSTELCASNEATEKSVSIVDISEDKIDIRQVPLKTREVMRFRIFDELSMNDADHRLRSAIARNPLTFLEYSSSLRSLIELKLVEWQALGLTLIQPNMIVEVSQDDTYRSTKESSDREMETIIEARLVDHPHEQAAAIALWKTPGAVEEIIEELERSLRTENLQK